MIEKVIIYNFKKFREATIEFNSEINLLVGDNNAGKSTLLEAIYLVLTRRINGKLIDNELTHYLFNIDAVSEYLASLKSTAPLEPPYILIEAWINGGNYKNLKGNNNSLKSDATGIKLLISFNEIFREEYEDLKKNNSIKSIPVDYYKVEWFGFDNNTFFPKMIPEVSFIDTSRTLLSAGSDAYLKEIISQSLNSNDRAALSMAYLNIRHDFAENTLLKQIDAHLLTNPYEITDSSLAVTLDLSQRSSWDKALTIHVAGQPFELAGRGEQSNIKAMLALRNKSRDAKVILFEEPENHLSFSSMRILMKRIGEHCKDKQLFITTHSSYVLNKLGLNNLIFLSDRVAERFSNLPSETYDYFKSIPGYDTLRLVLAKKVILVEGPSDELIVQRAYFDRHGHMPIDDGVDVISVRGLSFKRFLDLARLLKKSAVVLTDNDGDIKNNIFKKYENYINEFNICYSNDESLETLEPSIIECNDVIILNKIFGFTKGEKDKPTLIDYMKNNKTEWAISILCSDIKITYPEYINNAIKE